MVNAKDLRIGNWIMKDNKKLWRGDDGNYVKVTIDELIHIDNDGSFYSPILLTKKLLGKCGFELDTQDGVGYAGWYLKNKLNCFNISIWFGELTGTFRYSINDSCSIWVEYLHQLQNLYHSLTGEELDINL